MKLIMENWRGYQEEVLIENFNAWDAPDVLTEEIYLIEEGKIVDFIKKGFEWGLNKAAKKFSSLIETGEKLGLQMETEALLKLAKDSEFEQRTKIIATYLNTALAKPKAVQEWKNISEAAGAETGKLEAYLKKQAASGDPGAAEAFEQYKAGQKEAYAASMNSQIETAEKVTKKKVNPSTKEFLIHIAKASAGKFIFGFIDNFIMVCCGQWLDQTVGRALGLGAMGAAGIANGISDAAADKGESTINNALKSVGLDPEEIELSDDAAKWKHFLNNNYSPIAIFIGCIVGMFPLVTGTGPAVAAVGTAMGVGRLGKKIYQKRQAKQAAAKASTEAAE